MKSEVQMKKVKKQTAYQKAVERMNRETARAIAHVEFLEKLYSEAKKNLKNSLDK
jgi:hypothetical protein